MSPQERQVLQEFLDQLTQVRGIAKDPEADAMIARAVAQQPAAAYLLVQKALLQEQALNAAKQQIAALQSQVQAAQGAQAGGSSFLDPGNAWGRSAGSAPHPAAAPAMPPQQYAAPDRGSYAPPPQAARPGLFGGGGSFLGNMAATAAGVAGGAFLFQGLESLLGHHGAGNLMGQQGFGSMPPENVTVNEYIDERGADRDTDSGADDSNLASDAGLDDIDTDYGSSDDDSVI